MHPIAVSRYGVLFASDLRALGYDTRSLPRAVSKGTMHRLLRGAYVESVVWAEADAREQHILRLRAIDGTRAAQPVFSHASAAALHEPTGVRPGTSVASPEATRSAAGLKKQLVDALYRFAPARNFRRAEKALRFASHLSDSPGESLSRCAIHLLGFPEPELQHEFCDHQGFIGRGDFWWPGIRLLGEFDGEDKYKNPSFLGGRTPHQALMDEKRREDRIRQTKVDVSRWDWMTALELPRLYSRLFSAGLRPTHHRKPYPDRRAATGAERRHHETGSAFPSS